MIREDISRRRKFFKTLNKNEMSMLLKKEPQYLKQVIFIIPNPFLIIQHINFNKPC
tara:strand:+ start:227 stop:394 length:168 start_codon:yes stop_codon:yes gene_type:complete